MKQKFKLLISKIKTKWVLLILLMFIPIIIEIINNSRSLSISYEEYENIIASGDAAIVYFDSKDSPVKNTIIKDLKKVLKNSEALIKNLDYDVLSSEQRDNLININKKIINGPALAFINKGLIIDVRNGAYSESEIVTFYNKYFSGEIEDIYYRVAGSAEEFSSVVKEDKITMVVFGATSCSFCQKYKPVVNDLASKYIIDVYNFDFDAYDENEFQKVLMKNYSIPAKSQSVVNNDNEKMSCTQTGTNSTLSNEYYRTPLTLFFKKEKVIDCISGYIDSEKLEAVFKYHKIKKVVEK